MSRSHDGTPYFGCHTSLLGSDKRILERATVVHLDCPLTDLKHCSDQVDIGLVEGRVAPCANTAKYPPPT